MLSNIEFEEKYPENNLIEASFNNLSINPKPKSDDLDTAIIESLYNKAHEDIVELLYSSNKSMLFTTLYIENKPFRFWINTNTPQSSIDYNSLCNAGLKSHIDTKKTPSVDINGDNYYGFAPYIELCYDRGHERKTKLANCFNVMNFSLIEHFDGIIGFNFFVKYGAMLNFGDKIILQIKDLELVCDIIDVEI